MPTATGDGGGECGESVASVVGMALALALAQWVGGEGGGGVGEEGWVASEESRRLVRGAGGGDAGGGVDGDVVLAGVPVQCVAGFGATARIQRWVCGGCGVCFFLWVRQKVHALALT